MRELQRILVCLDLSEYSMSIMEYGVVLGRGLLTEIVVLNVINMRDVEAVRKAGYYIPYLVSADKYVEELINDRKASIRHMIEKEFYVDRDKMQIRVELGIPFRAILETIEAEDVDLVVMGNKGHGNVIETLFGSTAEKVFRHSPVPVLSIRNGTRSRR